MVRYVPGFLIYAVVPKIWRDDFADSHDVFWCLVEYACTQCDILRTLHQNPWWDDAGIRGTASTISHGETFQAPSGLASGTGTPRYHLCTDVCQCARVLPHTVTSIDKSKFVYTFTYDGGQTSAFNSQHDARFVDCDL